MDPSVTNGLSAAFAHLALAAAQQHQERLGRQSDAAQEDNRALTAGVFKAVTESDSAEIFGTLNAGSHVPTSQPYVVPNFVYNPGAFPKA